MATKWFAVKTFFRSFADGRPERPDLIFDPDATLVEERTLLIRAPNRNEAIRKAEKEAKDYAKRIQYKNPYNQEVTTRYLGFFDIYELSNSLNDKTEVFSTTRLMSKNIADRKISRVYLGQKEKDFKKSKRKKFINRDYYNEQN